jgi:hypothetical protein
MPLIFVYVCVASARQLAFHFRGLKDETSTSGQGEGGMVVYSVRIGDGKETTIYRGYPPDGVVSAYVHCGPAEFLYINSGEHSLDFSWTTEHIHAECSATFDITPVSVPFLLLAWFFVCFATSGKASARDMVRLGLQGKIWVSGFKVSGT